VALVGVGEGFFILVFIFIFIFFCIDARASIDDGVVVLWRDFFCFPIFFSIFPSSGGERLQLQQQHQ